MHTISSRTTRFHARAAAAPHGPRLAGPRLAGPRLAGPRLAGPRLGDLLAGLAFTAAIAFAAAIIFGLVG